MPQATACIHCCQWARPSYTLHPQTLATLVAKQATELARFAGLRIVRDNKSSLLSATKFWRGLLCSSWQMLQGPRNYVFWEDFYKRKRNNYGFPFFFDLLPPPASTVLLSAFWKHAISHSHLGEDFALAHLFKYQRIPLMFILLPVNKCLREGGWKMASLELLEGRRNILKYPT